MLNKLTNRIDILVPNSGQDSTGGVLPPQVWLAGIWAGVEDQTGREVSAAGQFGSDLTVKFTVRFNSQITPRCIVRFNNKLYTISYLRDPASGAVSQPFKGNVGGSRLLRGQYLELITVLTNDQQDPVVVEPN
jgi:SPP1 family predicted phage head-tail adaptor